ncbi:MAG TPA: hypothetical protein VN849_08115, partial [Stellaceae bacterium]|nr:hypothetical protein [Stellaceae bacterium]
YPTIGRIGLNPLPSRHRHYGEIAIAEKPAGTRVRSGRCDGLAPEHFGMKLCGFGSGTASERHGAA